MVRCGSGYRHRSHRGEYYRLKVRPYIFGHWYASKTWNHWDRSLALTLGIPAEPRINGAAVGIRWSPINEWKHPDFAPLGLILGKEYRRHVDEFSGTRKQWRLVVGLDYKL